MKFKHIIFSLFMIGAVACASHSNSSHNEGKEGRESGEGGEEHGTEGSEARGGEDNAGEFALDYRLNQEKYGARLILSYNQAQNSFIGTVENTTNETLERVRVEVHLSNGTELGPTKPTSLAPGIKIDIALPATEKSFDGWTAHAEVGNKEAGHGNEGEGGEGREGGEGHGSEGREANEAAMSSPITPLNQSWKGTLGGLTISMQYDASTKSIYGTVKNTTSKTLCYVQAEPHLKRGERTVGEMGPGKLGDLKPGQEVTSRLYVKDEPELADVNFDGYVIHMEIFDCNGSGPVPHNEESGEGREHGGE